MKIKKIIMLILLVLILILISLLFVHIDSNKNKTENNIKTYGKNSNDTKEEVLILKDKFFITQLNDIYYNIDEYKGKRIEISGFPMTDGKRKFVGRYGPGCCSNDSYAYIEYKFSDELDLVDEKDWIKVTGTIEKRYEGSRINTYIKATSVEKLDVRGLDTVVN